ncbi:unnamed protein product [Musa hybrid cultivar]
MENHLKSQIAKIVLLLLVLLFIPLVPASIRPCYLFFLLNILILALGVEAGFLQMISEPHDEKNITTSVATPVTIADMLDCAFHEGTLHPLKDSDGEDGDEEEEEEEEKCEDIGELSTQELFTKCEAFIGNFYKQLRTQREQSWRKIHDLRAF